LLPFGFFNTINLESKDQEATIGFLVFKIGPFKAQKK